MRFWKPQREIGGKLFPPGGERAKSWPGLVNQQDVRFIIDSQKMYVAFC